MMRCHPRASFSVPFSSSAMVRARLGGVAQLTRDMTVALRLGGVRVKRPCPGFAYTSPTKPLTDAAVLRGNEPLKTGRH